MSTRCNVIVKYEQDELIFYRHSDGYPEGTLPTLQKFMDLVKSKAIRDNVTQSSGWLVIIGAIEYQTIPNELFSQYGFFDKDNERIFTFIKEFSPLYWQCGAYEPTVCVHGDIEFLYVVDLKREKIFIDGHDGYTYEGKFRE